MPFVRDGLARGERAYHVLHPRHHEEHLTELRSAEIDVDDARRNRQLEMVKPEDTYLRGGHFDKEAMLTLIQQALVAGSELGFPLTRLIAHAESVLDDWSAVNDWVREAERHSARAWLTPQRTVPPRGTA